MAFIDIDKIGSINAGAVMVADDLALITSDAHSMQQALSVAEIDASRDRYVFNCDKTKTVLVQAKLPSILTLYGEEVGCSASEKHLGIYRNAKNTNMDTVHERVKSARRATYSLMGAGLHGLNGVGPEVALMQYKIYVIPILLYGLESLVLNPKEIETLEIYHRTCLRYIQHLPKSTAKAALHLLSGVLPVSAMLSIQALTLFRNIIACQVKAPPAVYMKELILRQLAMKNLDNASWASHIRRLLHVYGLPNAYEVARIPPSKLAWKDLVKTAVYDYYHTELLNDADEKTSLACMNVSSYVAGTLHPMWKDLSTPMEIMMATVIAQLLVGRYPLATSYTYRRGKVDICPLCNGEPETIEHFLLYCPQLEDIRSVYMPRLFKVCRALCLSISPEDLVKYMLDFTYFQHAQPSLKLWCAKWVYKLHQRRSMSLENPLGNRVKSGP